MYTDLPCLTVRLLAACRPSLFVWAARAHTAALDACDQLLHGRPDLTRPGGPRPVPHPWSWWVVIQEAA